MTDRRYLLHKMRSTAPRLLAWVLAVGIAACAPAEYRAAREGAADPDRTPPQIAPLVALFPQDVDDSTDTPPEEAALQARNTALAGRTATIEGAATQPLQDRQSALRDRAEALASQRDVVPDAAAVAYRRAEMEARKAALRPATPTISAPQPATTPPSHAVPAAADPAREADLRRRADALRAAE